jgi:predicted aminopeptidase
MMSSLFARRLVAGLIGVTLAMSAGCGRWPPGYLPSAVFGELRFLSQMVPIESALDDPTLTEEERDKLAFLLRARDYSRDVVGLKVGNNFQQFVNLHGKPLAWNLTASRKDAFEPYMWYIPIAGRMPYLGFFSKDQAVAERSRLVNAHYDTFIYEVDAFALPFLPDPVTSRVLRRDYPDLADTVAHELLHNTVMSPTDVVYSESLAVFVGRKVAIDFVGVEFGEDSALIEQALNQYEDTDTFGTYLADLTDELTSLYSSNLSSAEKIAQRQAVFEAWQDRFTTEALPQMHDPEPYQGFSDTLLNNAFLLVNTRYNSHQDLFEQGFELAGRDWAQALALFRSAAEAPDPFQYLETIVNAGQ